MEKRRWCAWIRTRGCRMVSTDETTELWKHLWLWRDWWSGRFRGLNLVIGNFYRLHENRAKWAIKTLLKKQQQQIIHFLFLMCDTECSDYISDISTQ